VFPARYELNSYIVFRKRLVSRRLRYIYIYIYRERERERERERLGLLYNGVLERKMRPWGRDGNSTVR
jgi:hypothetical protein